MIPAGHDKLFGDKVHLVLAEFKAGKLKASSGEKVTDHRQAVAIALSEAQAHVQQYRKLKGRYKSPAKTDTEVPS